MSALGHKINAILNYFKSMSLQLIFCWSGLKTVLIYTQKQSVILTSKVHINIYLNLSSRTFTLIAIFSYCMKSFMTSLILVQQVCFYISSKKGSYISESQSLRLMFIGVLMKTECLTLLRYNVSSHKILYVKKNILFSMQHTDSFCKGY